MPLEKQTIGIDFVGGLDTKTDEKLLEAPFLTLLENGVFTRGGSVKKRHGYSSLSDDIFPGTDKVDSGIALGNFERELVLLSSTNAYSRTVNSDGWIDKGRNKHFRVTRRQVVRNDSEQLFPTVGTCRGLTAFAWHDSRVGVRLSADDNIPDTDYISDEPVTSVVSYPSAITVGENVFFMMGSLTTGEIRTTLLSCSGPEGVVPPILFDNDYSTTLPSFDIHAVDFGPIYLLRGGLVAFTKDSDGEVAAAFMTETGAKGGSGSGFPDQIDLPNSAGASIVACRYDNILSKAAFAFVIPGTEIRMQILTGDLSTVESDVVVTTDLTIVDRAQHLAIAYDGTNYELYVDAIEGPAPADKQELSKIYRGVFTTAGATITPLGLTKIGGILAAKPIVVDGRVIVFSLFRSTDQYSYFAFDGADGTIYGRWLAALAFRDDTLPAPLEIPPQKNPLPAVPSIEGNRFLFPAMEKSRLRSVGGDVFSLLGASEVTLDFDHPRPGIDQVSQNMLIAGGVMRAYDGDSLTELGYLTFPANITATPSETGGAMQNGDYIYRVIFEWTDNQGLIHRSAPSIDIPVSVPLVPPPETFTGSVTLEIPTPAWTDKLGTRDPMRVVAYRTTIGPGTVFFRVTSDPPPIDTVTGLVTITDTLVDTAIESNEFLYTTGGELFNDPPPPSTILLVAKNRVFLGDTEDGHLWYSKKFVEGEGTAFNLGQRIKPEGEITALAELDDKIVVFERNRIFIISGDGPNALGQQNSFTPLQLVSTNVGCIDYRSVVEMSEGIMFQSDKGVYIISRSLAVQYIGAPVEEFNDQTITDGTLVPNVNQIRFLTESGVTLLYDYFFNQWATWTNFTGVDATNWLGTYVHLKPTGFVNRETENLYLDNSVAIPLKIETAWLKLAGVQGFQRIYRVIVLGDFQSPHTLLFKVAYDYQQFNQEQLQFDTRSQLPQVPYGTGIYGEQTPYGGIQDNVYQFRAKLCRQKCEAIKFGFEDAIDATGESYILSDLMLQVGVKQGLFKTGRGKEI
jgi:hypothetical protein